MRNLTLSLFVVSLVALSVETARAASFMGLGELPVGVWERWSVPLLSSDGRVVIYMGNTRTSPPRKPVFRWTAETGWVELDLLAGNPNLELIRLSLFNRLGPLLLEIEGISALSADGSVVAGWVYDYRSDEEDGAGFRWTAETGMVSLTGIVNLDRRAASPSAMSADGEVIVGTYELSCDECRGVPTQPVPFRWTPQTGIVYMGREIKEGWGTAVSADGKVIVGFAQFRNFVVGDDEVNGHFPFRWTEETGLLPLVDTPTPSEFGHHPAVSEDGSVIVGSRFREGSWEGYRWTEETGVVGLGLGEFHSTGISADGSVILGETRIWDAANGVRSLRDVFVNDFGFDLTGWTLWSSDISADARVIAGIGINPAGNREVWMAIVPEPSTGGLAVLGLLCLLSRLSVHRRILCARPKGDIEPQIGKCLIVA